MKEEHELLRVVLDTNVLLSALGFKGKETAKIWDLVEAGRIEVFLSPFILEEFERNLIKKAGFPLDEAKELVSMVQNITRIIHPVVKISAIRRKDSDNRILECAVESGAVVLVTGNMQDLEPLGMFRGIQILTPREFLSRNFPGS